MSPEFLVLQPKVTEVRWTEWAVNTAESPVLSVTSRTLFQTVCLSSQDCFSWLGSSHSPASFWLSSDESACLSCCSSVGQTLWNGVIVVQHAKCTLKHIKISWRAYLHSRPPLLPISDHIPRFAFNQGHLLLSLSISVPLCIGQICANLPVASVFVFFLSFSLCRFTLTYRELILLFLSFNKLLSKRWELPFAAHTISPSRVFPSAFCQKMGGNIIIWSKNYSLGHGLECLLKMNIGIIVSPGKFPLKGNATQIILILKSAANLWCSFICPWVWSGENPCFSTLHVLAWVQSHRCAHTDYV